jgi:hypothetical protein
MFFFTFFRSNKKNKNPETRCPVFYRQGANLASPILKLGEPGIFLEFSS